MTEGKLQCSCTVIHPPWPPHHWFFQLIAQRAYNFLSWHWMLAMHVNHEVQNQPKWMQCLGFCSESTHVWWKCASPCVHYCTDEVENVCLCMPSAGLWAIWNLQYKQKRGKPSWIHKEKNFFQPSLAMTHLQWGSNTCGGRLSAYRHLVQPNHRVGFITSEARLGFRLIPAKWTIESRSGPRFPAEHKVTLSSIKPYVCQMLLAWVPFKETIKHNYRNI